jgi:3-phenylpropionate/trans-cinnamate dioxygenase ferredoxin subunit
MTETRAYTRACALSDLPVEGVIGVEVAGEPVAVARTGGEVFALRDVCSHAEVPLSEGEIYDHTVRAAGHRAGARLSRQDRRRRGLRRHS